LAVSQLCSPDPAVLFRRNLHRPCLQPPSGQIGRVYAFDLVAAGIGALGIAGLLFLVFPAARCASSQRWDSRRLPSSRRACSPSVARRAARCLHGHAVSRRPWLCWRALGGVYSLGVGINGCASVLSAILAALLAMYVGFTGVVTIATILNLVAPALLAGWWDRRDQHALQRFVSDRNHSRVKPTA